MLHQQWRRSCIHLRVCGLKNLLQSVLDEALNHFAVWDISPKEKVAGPKARTWGKIAESHFQEFIVVTSPTRLFRHGFCHKEFVPDNTDWYYE